MIKYDVYLDDELIEELKKIPGTVSEHIRQAIFEYLLKNQRGSLSKSAEIHKKKKGVN